MIVVVVFLAGLGLGAGAAGRWLSRATRPSPLAALALVEALLALLNLGVTLALGLDLGASVQGAWRLALSVGLPLRAVYALGATLLLLPPTLLMGATVPLAAAGCQRQLGASRDALLPILLFVNTVGAALGAGSATALLLPWMGQRAALGVAIGANLLAAAIFTALAREALDRPQTPAPAPQARAAGSGGLEIFLGAALGLLSLSYEMGLIRALTLCFEPLPQTFATALATYLVLWSVGVALSSRLRLPVPALSGLTAALVLAMPPLFHLVRDGGDLSLLQASLLFCLPCLPFGLLYGGLCRTVSVDWGRDLGRFTAANTLGSCAGVLLATLVGFEAPLSWGAGALALGLVAVTLAAVPWPRLAGLCAVVALFVLAQGTTIPFTVHNGERAWWGRDGVVELNEEGQVYIDGLWHTRLSDGDDHIGEPYAWLMAAAAVIGRGDRPLRKALVVGGGVGISGHTLAGVDGATVDSYEINQTLRRLHEAEPAGTLGSLTHPAIRWIWTDARVGLALDETRYDLILSAPLHLRAAGSSLLLSDEYLRLVKSRLEPDGVLVVYANEGNPAQALLVQRTLAEHFLHRVTWNEGMITVASDQPLDLSAEALDARMAGDDRFAAELRTFDRWLREAGEPGGLYDLYEGTRRADIVADHLITDDHPLLEYPEVALQIVHPIAVSQMPLREP